MKIWYHVNSVYVLFLATTERSSVCQSILVKEVYLEKTCKNVKLKDWDVVVAGEVDGGFEGHGLQAWADGMHFVKALPKHFPWHYCPVEHK